MDPLSGAAAGINSSIRIFEVTYQLKAVDEQTADLISTTRHVDNNLNEARRLRRLKVTLLDAGERAWIDGVIQDTDKALSAVAQLIEPARVDKNIKEGINFKNRVMWVFRDNPKVRDKHAGLTLCHQSLMTVIACLYSKDSTINDPTDGSEKGEKPPPYDPQTEDLFNWRNQRRRKKGNGRGDSNTERATSTTSVSTSSVSTSTSPTSPSSFTTPLSSTSSTMEGFERATSIPADEQMNQTSNPLASLPEGSSEQQALVGSTSTGSMVTSPLSPTVGIHGVDMERPLSATWGSPRRKPVPYNPQLSSTNDRIPSDWFRATQESLYNVSMRPLSNPEPLRSRLHTDPHHSSSMSNVPVLDPSFRAQTSGISYASQSQFEDSGDANCSNADHVTMPSVAGIGSDPSTNPTSDYSAYKNVSGLKDQNVYIPYRRPTMGQESQSFTTASTESLSLFSSGLASRSERSYSAGQIPAYNPPRFPGDTRYSPRAFIAELEANICESATGYRDQESNGGDHDMEGKILGSETGVSTSARQGHGRRGRRSWLMFHATRSDLGRYMG